MSSEPSEDPSGLFQRSLADIASRLLDDQTQAVRDVMLLLGSRTENAIRRRFGHSLSDADYDDVMSIALFRLWQWRGSFDASRSRLDRWFYVLARNTAIDMWRRRQKVREDVVDDLDALPARGVSAAASEESPLRRDLSLVLEHVSETDKRIVLSGLTDSELSVELGMKPGTIRVRRLRIKEKLRSALRDMGHVVEG